MARPWLLKFYQYTYLYYSVKGSCLSKKTKTIHKCLGIGLFYGNGKGTQVIYLFIMSLRVYHLKVMGWVRL